MSDEQHIQSGRDTIQAGRNVTQAGSDVVGGDKVTYYYYAVPKPENERERRNRTVMLQKVYDFWVTDVLENSLHRAALIELGMEYQPDAVAYPWEMIVECPDTTPRTLPRGTPIVSVFDDLQGALLILGSPGSGKTTMLLELTRILIARAQQHENHSIPVVFNLSSWAEQCLPLADWLVEELNVRYDVPRKVGQAWINNDQVLPLLDGLDEVRQNVRNACVEAINAYRREHGMVEMVVCSRVSDYVALTAKLKLHGAIMLQPLTDDQIDSYLEHAGDQLIAVRKLLHEDAEVRIFANTPLMLSIMTLAYKSIPLDELIERTSPDMRRNHLFNTYVGRMLNRRGGDQRYTPEQTKHWLNWQAKQLQLRGRTVFFIEDLQPDWLPNKVQKWVVIFGTSLLWAVVGFVVGALIGIIGATIGKDLGVNTVGGIDSRIVGAIVSGLGAAAVGMIVGYDKNIRPAEIIRWSKQSMLEKMASRAIWGLALGVTMGVAAFIFVAPNLDISQGVQAGIVTTAIASVLFALSFIILGGLVEDTVGNKTKPNEGIWRSFRIASFLGLIFSIIGAVGGSLVGIPAGWLIFGTDGIKLGLVVDGLYGTAALGLIYSVWNGGRACVQHVILRLLLILNNQTPLNYVRFLDHAAERILLRKVGGGYIFVHRMLLEYFASLEPEPQRKAEREAAQ